MAMTGYGEAAVANRPSTFVDPIESAHGSLTTLTDRIANLADRLCGSRGPSEKVSGGTIAAVPDGVFPTLGERGRDMNRKLDAAFEALARIENALP